MRRRGHGFMHAHRWGQQNTPQAPSALQQANQLLAAGQYDAAALQFEALAQSPAGQNTPFLCFQAGRARILMGDLAAGMAHLHHGLALLAENGQAYRRQNVARRIAQELRASGHSREADEILALVETTVSPPAQPTTARATLPTHCPACGAPLRPDEAEWLDKQTAECPYCGSPVRANV